MMKAASMESHSHHFSYDVAFDELVIIRDTVRHVSIILHEHSSYASFSILGPVSELWGLIDPRTPWLAMVI